MSNPLMAQSDEHHELNIIKYGQLVGPELTKNAFEHQNKKISTTSLVGDFVIMILISNK